MAFFIKTLNSQLYVAPTTDNDKGFAAFLLPNKPGTIEDGYDINRALTDTTLAGTFILSAFQPDMSSEAAINDLVTNLLLLLGQARYIIWIQDFSNFNATTNTLYLPIENDGSSTNQGLLVPLIFNINLQIPNGLQLAASDTSIILGSTDSSGAKIQFTGSWAPDSNISYATSGLINLTGSYRSCVSFGMNITRFSLSTGFTWGFQMLIPLLDNPNQNAISEYLPFAKDADPDAPLAIGFNITIDPTDVFNTAFDYTNEPVTSINKQYNSRRTVFDFTGQNQDESQTILNSYYFTTWGQNVKLIPGKSDNNGLQARFVFNQGEVNSSNAQQSLLAPEGDFIILVDNATQGATYPLQCGLQGTEFFNVQSQVGNKMGDSIRFIANQAAYAPVYPLPQSSPVTAPVDADAPLLDATYRSSWCTIVNAASNTAPTYVAQPKGAALFGTVIDKNAPTLYGHSKPNFTFTPNDRVLFPMLPYTAVVPDATGLNSFSLEQIEDFETLFISPVRKKNINNILIQSQQNARLALKGSALTAIPVTTVATPSGLIAGLSSANNNNPTWQSIYLAQNQEVPNGPFTEMYFDKPDDELVQAFQTSDLFLVIANNTHIGTTADNNAAGAKFYNNMFIGDWTMQANTGTQNRYNDYNNIIIVKGKKGKLYDPADVDNSLIANWQKWTERDSFASPTTLDSEGKLSDPDPSQLVILSQWMQTYFENAANQTDTAYFGNFNTIAKDPNWTGILILGMNISDLPTNLYGILSGVRFPNNFRAHHFGVNITPVKQGTNGPKIDTASSMFGLIYYNDPDFIASPNPQPIEPNLTNTYDFVLLNLKVLFENTAVKSFQSYAQLTTNAYFGSSVDHMGTNGNSFNTMILKGALQFKGDEAIYSLGTNDVNTFYFNSPVVNKIEISNASFSTVGVDEKGMLVSRFAISGFWDFKKLKMQDDTAATTDSGNESTTANDDDPLYFDIFSFGNDDLQNELPRKGLIFNNLGIQMVSPQYKPGQTDPLPKTMTFDTAVMTFDQGRSTPRPDSIYVNFALNLQNIVQGTKDTTPSGKDYLTVITDMKVGSIEGTPWVGLSYQLNMGTPGALAGNVGLTSTLLTAWDPTANDDDEDAPPVFVGIKLPGTGGGAKLISLQSVLKLSIGQIRLAVDRSNPNRPPAFLLMFTEIALKFLGLLKIPPNGSSLFYLFGNPQTDGKASGLGWYAMYKKDDSSEKAIA